MLWNVYHLYLEDHLLGRCFEARVGKSVYAGANHPSLANFLQYTFKVQKAEVGSKTAVGCVQLLTLLLLKRRS